MPHPDPRELATANVGSNIRPRSATRDLRASQTGWHLGKHTNKGETHFTQMGITGEFVRVFPARAEFRDTEPGVTHVLTITVVNRSDHVKRIRFIPPKTKEFTLHQIPTIGVAPGLEMSADLEYYSDSPRDFYDEVTILCETDRITVPIYAYAPRADLHFDGYCLFGSVSPNQMTIRYVDLVNRGSKAAEFSFLQKEDIPFQVEPLSGRLGPEGSDDCFLRLKVSFSEGELGVYRSVLECEVNKTVIGTVLDMSAMVVRQQFETVSPEGSGRIERLNFGTVYVGEEREQTFILVNDGPEEAEFNVVIPKPDNAESTDPHVYSAEPATGLMAPFEQLPVKIKYHPPRFEVAKGFKSKTDVLAQREEHEVSVLVTNNDESQTTNLKLSGRAVFPGVTFSEHELYFANTPSGQTTELAFTIKNHHDELPVTFRSTKVAHFRCRPATGRLLPLQSTQVIVSFCPNQLGRHKGNFVFEIQGSTGQAVGRANLMGSGLCDAEGPKKKLLGGTKATDDTFKPNFNFQSPDALANQTTKNNFVRLKHWIKHPPEVNENTVKYTMDASEMAAVDANKQKYQTYLKDQYEVRNKVHTLAEGRDFALGTTEVGAFDPHDDPEYKGWPAGAKPGLDMGLFSMPVAAYPPGVGLKEPRLVLPPANEPLYLKHRPGEAPAAIKPKSRVHDEDRLITLKFKSHPTGGREKKECQAFLNARQIMQLGIHPSSMEFGSICLHADVGKCFSVSNDTQSSIHVQVNTHGNPILERSTPASQVIPPGATAGFDIVLYLEAEKLYETHFSYTINGHHTFQVPVRAQAVPVMLSVSKQKINFSFPGHSFNPSVTEVIQVINPGNNAADWRIENTSPHFTAFPMGGTVEALGQEELAITYTPGQTTKHEHSMRMNVVGGSEMPLLLSGEVEEGVIVCKTKIVDFGPIAAGMSSRKDIKLGNSGQCSAVWYVDLNEMRKSCPGLSINPDKGLVLPGETVSIVATVRNDVPLKVDAPLMISVRGGKPVKCTIKFDIQRPNVDIKTDELDFGKSYLGAISTRPLTIANTSQIPAIFTFDLRKYPEFSIVVPEEFDYEEEEEVGALARKTPASASGSAMGLDDDPDMIELEGQMVKFRLPPSTEAKFDVTYQPVTLSQHEFVLPISVQGIIPGSEIARRALGRVCVAESIKPRMLMSSASIDFAKRVVVTPNMKGFTYTHEVTLTNCDDVAFTVDCKLKGQSVDQGIFRLEQTINNQHLNVGKSITLCIHFVPRTDNDYKAKLIICLDNNTATPYFTVEVKGSGVFPSLGFDRREVILPNVPCGQMTSATFYVINHGYDNLDLKYQLPPESSAVPLQISFPQGMMIGVVRTHLLVEVSFVSKKPVSFSAKIDFLDGNGNTYSIPVVGTTDSCMLSAFPYLTIHKESFTVDARPSKPIMIQNTAALKEPYLSPEGAITLDSGDDDKETKKRMAQPNAGFLCECAVLTKKENVQAFLEWGNLNMFRQPVTRFPEDLLENKGRPLIDVIEASTGKTVPGQSRKAAANKREEGQMLLANHIEMLNFLKSYGALVNTVIPEYLLPWDHFQRLYIDAKGGMLEDLKEWYETYYSLINGATWMLLLYQTVRLFVLNRFTPKLLRTLPGVNQKYLPMQYVHQGSNLYSQSEIVLMQWLTYHHSQVSPADKLTVTNFDKDLQDCRVYASVLINHVPSTKKSLVNVRKTDNAKGCFENAQVLVAAMQALQIDYCPSAQDLATGPPRDQLLFCIHLFNTMPGFVPKATVSFDGRLNDGVQKHIELTNPSNKPLIYAVRIYQVDGSDRPSEFKCASSLRLGPREKALFPITVSHSQRAPAEAQIFFIGERSPGGNAGITMVFNLRSEVKTYRRTDTIQRDSCLYETISIDIPVKNPANDMEKEMMLSILDISDAVGSGGKEPDGKKKPPQRGAKKTSGKGPHGDATTSPLLPATTFWLKKDRIKLKKGATGMAHLMFVPMRLKGHSCLVFLRDEETNSETCFEVQVTVDLPAACETVKFTNQMKSTVPKDITLNMKNPSIEKCRASILELMTQQKGKEWYQMISSQPKLDYKVQYLTEHCSGPKEVSVHGGVDSKGRHAAQQAGQNGAVFNKLPLEIRPKGPGKYESKIILRSAFDVRVIDVECTITSLGTRAELVFACAARQSITQEIPIINFSDQPWNIHSELQGEYFTGQKDLNVPAATDAGPGRASYMLTFSPVWIKEVSGQLTLRNATVGDTYEYKLEGVGEEPLAEDHVVIDCRARWKKTVPITVRNVEKGKAVTYRVECDMGGITGKGELTVEADSEAEYELAVMMPRGGSFTGSITFIAPSQEYIWYTFEVNAENPPSERTVPLKAKARTAVAADITIVNPLDTVITFEVIMQGEGLLGAPSVALQPQESAVYELIYSPLVAGQMSGGLIFVNDEIGEFWYELQLESEEPDPIPVTGIKAELGKTSTTHLTIENPLGYEIEGEIVVSNDQNFAVVIPNNPYEDNVLLIGPYETAKFEVIYSPSSIGAPEVGQVVFEHPEAGTWVFEVEGKGHPPGEMPITNVNSTVMSSSSNMIHFRNPLNEEIEVQVSLEIDDFDGAVGSEAAPFQVFGDAEPIVLAPFREIDIPVIFAPKRMLEHSCRLIVSSFGPDELKWVYPIVGTAEASQCVHLGKFACKARESLKQSFLLELSGVLSDPAMADDDRTELEVIAQPDVKEMLATSLAVTIDDSLPKAPVGTCRVRMVFEPLKTVRTKVELKVGKASGGRWLFDFELVAHPADIDDTIKIEGSINKTSTVAFRMKNQFDVEAEFRAYFLPDSPSELSVTPSYGILAPYSSSDEALTEFKVTFSPKTYGKTFVGKLVVETAEMQWIYEVVGEPPKYAAPQEVATKVTTRLAPGQDPAEYKSRKPTKDYHKENTANLRLAQKTKR